MIYRPQFKYPTPPGFRDVPHEYYMSVAGLAGGVAANTITGFVSFTLDDDAPFYARAITGDFNNGSTVGLIQLITPHGDFVFSDYILIETIIGGMAGPAYIFNEEIYCPAGSTWQYSLQNPLGVTMPAVVPILRGIKRCVGCAQ